MHFAYICEICTRDFADAKAAQADYPSHESSCQWAWLAGGPLNLKVPAGPRPAGQAGGPSQS